jgi:N-acyl-D-amino-acid deacylase
MKRLLLVLAAAIVAARPTAETAAQPAAAYDIVIRHGTIVDGTGLARYEADIAIANGSIARIGTIGERGASEIDASGLFVTPGFINIHSHATPDGLVRAANMLAQGVTTEILNADGSGPVDLGEQLAAAERRGLGVNIGAQIGFNSIWSAVVGLADRRPTADEIARMRTMLVSGLEHGAWGVSAGLDYKPAYYARGEEVIQVVEAARPWRTNFPNHDRVTPESGYSSRAGMEETIAIGERAGVAPIITHMKVQGHEQGSADLILGKMREASSRGVNAAADAYPYLAGQTGLAALIIPGWAQDGGREAMLRRFADAAQRERIVAEAEEAMDARFGGAGGVYLPATKQQLTAVMADMHVRAGEAVVRLLEQGSPGIIARFGIEADLVKILQHPTTSIACDCGSVDRDASHPRYYGTFPRVLGRYVREQHALTWEDAVRKMTGLPAATIGMVDRGLLAPGMAADVTLFDPNSVIDHATFDSPTLPSDGVRIVIVNGRVALRDGQATDARAGRTLRRASYMPTRPMNGAAARRLTRKTVVDGATIAIDVAQAANARHATGTIRIVDAAKNVRIEMKELGVLQTSGDWASVTGRAKLRSSDPERSVLLIVDGARVMIDAGDYSVALP